jgi:adenosylcobinamide-phosphate synthase
MAGALGIKLAGPRAYGGVTVDDRFVGEGREDLSAADIRAAVNLYRVACALQGAAVGGLALVTLLV